MQVGNALLQKADFLRCGAFVEIDVHDVASHNQ